jgi:hypothetical protein
MSLGNLVRSGSGIESHRLDFSCDFHNVTLPQIVRDNILQFSCPTFLDRNSDTKKFHMFYSVVKQFVHGFLAFVR